jgi:hypothetical protein
MDAGPFFAWSVATLVLDGLLPRAEDAGIDRAADARLR